MHMHEKVDMMLRYTNKLYKLIRPRPTAQIAKTKTLARFAAIAPIAGSAIAIQADASALASTNIWMFQGEKDGISTAALGRKMSAWIKEAGGHIQYTEFEGIGHSIQKKAFDTNNFIAWLISQERK